MSVDTRTDESALNSDESGVFLFWAWWWWVKQNNVSVKALKTSIIHCISNVVKTGTIYCLKIFVWFWDTQLEIMRIPSQHPGFTRGRWASTGRQVGLNWGPHGRPTRFYRVTAQVPSVLYSTNHMGHVWLPSRDQRCARELRPSLGWP